MSVRLNRNALRRLIRPVVVLPSLVIALLAAALMTGAVQAQTNYPQRPVQVIIGFPDRKSVV